MNKYLTKSFVIWSGWIFTLAVLQVAWNGGVIDAVTLGNWTLQNLMIFISMIWIMGWFFYTAWTFSKQGKKMF